MNATTYSHLYDYSDKQPHAVSSITSDNEATQQYIYDANGRHSDTVREGKWGVQTPTRKLHWDAYGNLTKISQGLVSQHYYYDAKGNRSIKNNKLYPEER
ncbi:hypothetical protein [Psychrobacter sp. I-STPA6b]|uniref:hypothetical protein n=1 Tax=Psychrobacter sp. I-STPA6b TaxID=2585718 RepID=UPI001D0C1D98|nr:hypothetical protein [Psychrobacter sp. I-STPA6b]